MWRLALCCKAHTKDGRSGRKINQKQMLRAEIFAYSAKSSSSVVVESASAEYKPKQFVPVADGRCKRRRVSGEMVWGTGTRAKTLRRTCAGKWFWKWFWGQAPRPKHCVANVRGNDLGDRHPYHSISPRRRQSRSSINCTGSIYDGLGDRHPDQNIASQTCVETVQGTGTRTKPLHRNRA